MEIEHLNKTQIVLLTLLVAFVTSIATGIVTVSLLDQAPKTVTQTINRVVEHTVERVVPSIVEKEVPVIVKDEDLIIQAIERNQQSIVKIFSPADGITEKFLGYGAFISKDGILMTDASIAVGFTRIGVVLQNGKKLEARRLETKSSKRIHLYKAELSGNAVETTPVKFANSDLAKLGQSVIGIGSDTEKESIVVGVVTMIDVVNTGASTTPSRIRIDTSLDERNPATGHILLNLSGELVGFRSTTDTTFAKSSYSPINFLKGEMELAEKNTPAPVSTPEPTTPVATSTSTTTP